VDHSHTEHLQAGPGGWQLDHSRSEHLQVVPIEADFEAYLQLRSIEPAPGMCLLGTPIAAFPVVCLQGNSTEYCAEGYCRECSWSVHCPVRHLEVAH
jgi:hypothetical protein